MRSFSVRPEVNNNNSKCGPFPGCLKPLKIPAIPCCCVVFVAPLQWFMPLPGWVLANIFYLYSQGISNVAILFLQTCRRKNAASKLICHFQRKKESGGVSFKWGDPFFSQLVSLDPCLVACDRSPVLFFLPGPCRAFFPQCRRISVRGRFPQCNPDWLLFRQLPLSLHITTPILHAPHLFPEVRFRIRWECVQWH